MIIKVLAPIEAVTIASNVAEARLVRAYAVASALVTVATSLGAVKGSLTIPAGGVEIIEKDPTDTITSSSSLECTPVAFNIS